MSESAAVASVPDRPPHPVPAPVPPAPAASPAARRGTVQVAVFCGARAGARGDYVEFAAALGAGLAARGAGLVYGAGSVGVMGSVAAAARAGGARVVGVIPASLFERERPSSTGEELVVVRTMHDRKALMYRLSDAFIGLPGGLGTLDELMEVATWSQLGLHAKPVVLLDVAGYFRPLLAALDHAVAEGFVSAADRALITVAETVGEALDLIAPARGHEDDRAVEAGRGLAAAPFTPNGRTR
ncbi:TIGR00730 family Rossman fold protein [Actinomadura violacea]|uniref:Cytokinin riboside 5'-monophosphate phosphoribohydrolase n=1 Tax=Actinomadura violacea TaxID=2819934 RepID=A0ABS3RQI4_9ACTN|nr:TIGR00730 family Rossman fold protein [Actinomadura violacea]MBO2458319.1 TIGR00730 family Rossman fold protein [Actinomadura violacea]